MTSKEKRGKEELPCITQIQIFCSEIRTIVEYIQRILRSLKGEEPDMITVRAHYKLPKQGEKNKYLSKALLRESNQNLSVHKTWL